MVKFRMNGKVMVGKAITELKGDRGQIAAIDNTYTVLYGDIVKIDIEVTRVTDENEEQYTTIEIVNMPELEEDDSWEMISLVDEALGSEASEPDYTFLEGHIIKIDKRKKENKIFGNITYKVRNETKGR